MAYQTFGDTPIAGTMKGVRLLSSAGPIKQRSFGHYDSAFAHSGDA
jgi:hypothetical protein